MTSKFFSSFFSLSKRRLPIAPPCLLFVFHCVSLSSAYAAEPLSLDGFLEQVQSANKDLAISRQTASASEGKQADGDLILVPNVFASVQRADDRKPEANPLQGDRTEVTSLNVGVSKMTDFGLAGRISYGASQYDLKGANPLFVPEPSFYEAKPTIELTQALWKNAAGREIKATQELLRSQTEVIKFTEAFKLNMKMMEAEMTYWRVVLARESVRTHTESLARAVKLRDWSNEKARQQLIDNADVLQTEAAARGRKLELQMAVDEVRAASRAFNGLRGHPAEAPVEDTVRISPDILARHPAPERKTGVPRGDTAVAIAATKIATANLTLMQEKYTPQLDLFASASLNGKDKSFGKASSESLQGKYPTTVIGIKLNAPLGAESISRQRAAALADAGVSQLTVDARKFAEDSEWDSLAGSLDESRGRVKLAAEIAAIQKQRSDNERARHRTGRTTMFQVLMAEQDLAQADLNLIRSQAEMLRIIAQMKTFTATADAGVTK